MAGYLEVVLKDALEVILQLGTAEVLEDLGPIRRVLNGSVRIVTGAMAANARRNGRGWGACGR